MTAKTSTLERVLAGMLISDRLWLKSIYESTAKVVAADGLTEEPVIVTYKDWSQVHNSVKNFIWTGMSTVCPLIYPELIDAIDRHIAASVDVWEGPITPDVRRSLTASLSYIAWAGLGGDE
jgi:hypothetical protein